MKYERIIRKLTGEPWLILERSHNAIVDLVESKLGQSVGEQMAGYQAARPKEDFFGDPIEQMEFDGTSGVATIPIKGVMGAGLGKFEKSCGACDTRDVSEDLDMAVRRGARSIILNIDSPGGTVGGTPELADAIDRVQSKDGIPVYAFTAGLMASAAYWVGSTARGGVFATPSAEVGSIGVYLPVMDSSRRMQAFGYRIDIIKAGRYKAMGYPGTELSDDQRALLQSQIDDIYDQFTGHVLKNRKGITSDTMQGQTFMGKKAENVGLIDGLLSDIGELKRMIAPS